MAKYTLLDMVQIILSSMDSDEVNSIVDTTESLQVAQVIRQCYDNIVNLADLPEHYTLFELDTPSDPSTPVLLQRPQNIKEILWVQYDSREAVDGPKEFKPVKYMDPVDFLDWSNNLVTTDANVGTMSLTFDGPGSSIDFNFYTDRAPEFYTTFDDHNLIFNAYNSTVETTLQSNKTLSYGIKDVIFIMEDDFVAPIDDRMFTLLLNEAKSLAYAELKQAQHVNAERTSRRAWLKFQRDKTAVQKKTRQPSTVNYGRK